MTRGSSARANARLNWRRSAPASNGVPSALTNTRSSPRHSSPNSACSCSCRTWCWRNREPPSGRGLERYALHGRDGLSVVKIDGLGDAGLVVGHRLAVVHAGAGIPKLPPTVGRVPVGPVWSLLDHLAQRIGPVAQQEGVYIDFVLIGAARQAHHLDAQLELLQALQLRLEPTDLLACRLLVRQHHALLADVVRLGLVQLVEPLVEPLDLLLLIDAAQPGHRR